LFFLITGVVIVEPEGSSKCAVVIRNGGRVVLLLDRRDKGRLLIFCYVRHTVTSRETQCLKGGAHKETLCPWNNVTRDEVPRWRRSEDKTIGLG
jgi:hypothetical protein